MIKKVKLINFQSNKNTTLEFSPRVNVIHGNSDGGKSSFIRGICSNIYRDPFFISHFETEGSSLVEFDDYTIERKCRFAEIKKCPSCGEKINGEQRCKCGEILSGKSSSDKYIVGENEYDKFGKTLPDFIKEKIRMFPVRFVDVEDNIQFFSQHDDMFFVGATYSGGKRNKIISSLFPDSDRVDFLIKKFNSDASVRKQKIDIYDQELAELKKRISDGKDAYDMVKILIEELKELNEDLNEIKEDTARLTIIQSKIKESDKVIIHESKINKIELVLVKIKEKFSETIKIRELHSKLSEISSKVRLDYKFDVKEFEINEVETLASTMADMRKLSILKGNLARRYEHGLQNFDEINKFIDERFAAKRSIQKLQKLKSLISTKDSEIDEHQEKYGESMADILRKKDEFKKFMADSKTICPITNQEFCDKCKDVLTK